MQMPLSVLTGFSAGDGKTQGGVAVARLRRTAWISGLRADSTVEVSITLDSGRTSAASLEVDLEEIGADGLLQARRVRLGDLALPSHTAERLTVVLPTLGSGLQRRLRLYDHGGRLLDYVDASHFLERIVVQIVTPEGAAATTTIGAVTKPRDAVTRLSALDVAEDEYTRLLEEGLAHRIADDPDTARTVLKGMLAQARGELWVLDPYFGHTTDDWDVLQQVAVPVRVLTAHRRNHGVATAASAPAADLYARLPALHVRSWDMSIDRTPWHDRFYIWEGGGLSVGTSPNGLGRRQARIGHISPTEAAAWGLRFTHWWDHSAAVVVL
ncbi:hypothetical protein [Streptomyces sp. NPDC004435]|uniref:hypothetical protein n=1 Tax=Streptomyces sp. NPDC004435 TaxID=3364701 RepID=UPI0036B4009A